MSRRMSRHMSFRTQARLAHERLAAERKRVAEEVQKQHDLLDKQREERKRLEGAYHEALHQREMEDDLVRRLNEEAASARS